MSAEPVIRDDCANLRAFAAHVSPLLTSTQETPGGTFCFVPRCVQKPFPTVAGLQAPAVVLLSPASAGVAIRFHIRINLEKLAATIDHAPLVAALGIVRDADGVSVTSQIGPILRCVLERTRNKAIARVYTERVGYRNLTSNAVALDTENDDFPWTLTAQDAAAFKQAVIRSVADVVMHESILGRRAENAVSRLLLHHTALASMPQDQRRHLAFVGAGFVRRHLEKL